MKKFIFAIALVTTIIFSASAFAGEAKVYHMFLVDLKDGVTPQQVEEMFTVGNALLSKIPGVLEVSFGNKALDNRDIHIKDYDVAGCVKWENIDTGKTYGSHILHQSFLKLYKPLFAGIRVIDFYGN